MQSCTFFLRFCQVFAYLSQGGVQRYNAKVHPHLPKLGELLRGLSARTSLRPKVVVIRQHSYSASQQDWEEGWTTFDDFLNIGREKKLGRRPDGEIEWLRLPFDWPLWILFSSGTTGARPPTSMRIFLGPC